MAGVDSIKMRIFFVVCVLLFCSTYSAQAVKVACIGDSITEGANIPDRQNNSYPAQLAAQLRKLDDTRDWETQNFGVGGATLLQKGDKPYINQPAYQQALAWQPDMVVIMLGTNDSKPQNWAYSTEFVPDYCSLIDSFTGLASHPRIWICKPVPAFKDAFGITNSVIRFEIIPLIDEIARQKHVEVIDLYTPLLGADALFPDGIHPNTAGAGRIVQVIAPILLGVKYMPDFNGDGFINFIDYAMLVRHYDANANPDSFFDVTPAPNGDGRVDLRDLAGMVQYWLKSPQFVAYWKLDEAEGDMASDSIGDVPGLIHGGAGWLPNAGHKDGALALDGLDDYLETGFLLDPAEGPFTIFAWVKGGRPGQVLMSGASGQIWIGIDSVTGCLRTDLLYGARKATALVSNTPVAEDGQWHFIRFAWDGSRRYLYMDDIEVAVDSQPINNLLSSHAGFYFGAGPGLETDSFWTGMIDDLRIYKRAILPMF
jgi:acyl-CoA thioesterase-1